MMAKMTQANRIVEGTGKSILELAEKLTGLGEQMVVSIKAAQATLGPLAAL